MATYKCKNCNTTKNDTLISQLSVSLACKDEAEDSTISFHPWEKVSEEDV